MGKLLVIVGLIVAGIGLLMMAGFRSAGCPATSSTGAAADFLLSPRDVDRREPDPDAAVRDVATLTFAGGHRLTAD